MTPAALSGFSANFGTNSSAQNINVSGSALTGDISLSAPAGYEMARLGTGLTNFGTSLTLSRSNNAVAATSIAVRLATNAPSGPRLGDLVVSTDNTTNRIVRLSGTVVPALGVSTNRLAAFSARVSTVSAPQSFTVSGGGLPGNVSVSVPAGFELSVDGVNFAASALSLVPQSGTLNQSIAVRLAASPTPVSRLGNVTVSASTGLANPANVSRTVAVSGTVTIPALKQMSNLNQPRLPRFAHSQVWTGDRLIVWGGAYLDANYYPTSYGDGGVYDPRSNSWQTVNLSGAPSARAAHTAVWTGTEMIVWGGASESSVGSLDVVIRNNGAIYNPTSNNWRPMADAPMSLHGHTAVWTGTEMIVWGDASIGNSGMAYNPTSNTWRMINSTGAPSPRVGHSAVWTGQEMAIWGGSESFGSSGTEVGTGALYNPQSNTWRPISTNGAPVSGYGGNAIAGERGCELLWTGSRLIIVPLNFNTVVWISSGGSYDPSTGQWQTIGTAGLPDGRPYIAAWNGRRLFVAGSSFSNFAGFLYDPNLNRWTQSLSGVTGSFQGRIGTWAPELNEILVFGGMWAGSSASWSGGAFGARGFRLEQ